MAANKPEEKYEKRDSYEPDGVLPGSANGAKKFGICHILLGLALIGCCVPLLLDFSNYNTMKDPLQEVNSEFGDEIALPPYMLIAGWWYVVSGVVSLYAFYKDSRVKVYISIGIAFLASALALFISMKIKATKDLLFEKLQSNPMTDDNYGDGPLSILDFTAAIFNECCFSNYDSLNYTFDDFNEALTDDDDDIVDLNQRAVPECLDSVEETCPSEGDDAMFPAVVESVLSLLGSDEINELICHCFGNADRYDKFIEIFRRDDTCNSFRDIRIPKADDREIPVVGISFSDAMGALVLTNPEIPEELPIGEFALVGKFLPPASVYGEPSEDIGFSCGLGYAKGVALYLYFYLEDKTNPIIYGAFVCVAASALATALLGLMWGCGGNSLEDDDDYDEDYRIRKKEKVDDVEIRRNRDTKVEDPLPVLEAIEEEGGIKSLQLVAKSPPAPMITVEGKIANEKKNDMAKEDEDDIVV